MTNVTLFDYAGMSVADQVDLRATADRIRDRMKRTVEDIIAIGQDLLAVKSKLPHGAFLPWIETEFGMSNQTASRFMSVATTYHSKFPNLGNLSLSVIYELAAPSTPEPVRQVVEAKAEAGESVSVAEVQRLKREAATAAKRADDAEAEAQRQRTKADALAEGQRDLIEAAKEQARKDAEAKVAADLAKARADAEKAADDLDEERRKLEDATRKAEVTAMAKAKAEAESLAAAELAKVQEAARRAKDDEAKARANVERLSESASRLQAKVREHDAFLRARSDGEIEAKAVREHLAEADRVLAMAMLEMSDLEHEPPTDVVRSMARTAKVCRDFAQVLDQYGGPRLVYDIEGAQV